MELCNYGTSANIASCKSKFKPENPGLQAAKTRVFGFGKTVGNPSRGRPTIHL